MTRPHRDAWQARQFREKIANEAARLLLGQPTRDYRHAIRRASRKFSSHVDLDQLPTPGEVREHLRRLEATALADAVNLDPAALKLEALRLMRRLRAFEPRLRTIKEGEPEVLLRVHADDFERITDVLRDMGVGFGVQPVRQGFGGEPFVPVTIRTDFPCRIHVFAEHCQAGNWLSPYDGTTIDAIALAELEQTFLDDGVGTDLDDRLDGLLMNDDRFELFRHLLDRLESVKQDRAKHPEGDALHHSLQVYDLALAERPYDEEFLTAALLHDVGKAIDTLDSTRSSIVALEGAITHRTRWLIENLPAAAALRGGRLRSEERRILQDSEDFDDLMTLAECNAKGRVAGRQTTSLDDAVGHLRSLASGEYIK